VKSYILLIFLLLLPNLAYGAVGIGDTSSSTSEGTTVTYAHVVAGSETMLVVGVGCEVLAEEDATISSVTYNGDALTLIIEEEYDDQAGASSTFRDSTSLWYRIAPDTGTNNVIATCSTDPKGLTSGAITLTGVAQVAPEASASSNSDPSAVSTLNNAITTITNGAMIVDVAGNTVSGTVFTAGTGQTEFYQVSNDMRLAGSYELQPTAGSETMSWTLDTARITAGVAAAFAPSARRIISIH